MKKPLLALLIISSSALLFSGCLEKKTKETPEAVNPLVSDTPTTPDQAATEETTVNFYTSADIASHNQAEDCWFSIGESVYDVTPYIKGGLHPGEDKILLGCGKDATELYATKAGQGTDHSDKAKAYLQSFKIGELKK